MPRSRKSKKRAGRTPTPPSNERQRGRRKQLAAVMFIIIALVGWRAVLSPRGGDAGRGHNVLLITLDTLRADHLGCYGYDRVETPVIDGLAAGGMRIAQVAAAVPMTLPAHATIMTGLYPPRHGVRDNGTFRLTPEQETLAEILRRNGYATASFIAAFVLDARYGLDQGFDRYDDDLTLEYRLPTPNAPSNPDRPANVVVDAALEWLQTHQQSDRDAPFFAWVHLFDPHQPYAPPEPFRSRYADRPYDGEIAFMDAQIGRLLDGLRSLGVADKTLVVVVGDHGEGLGDHGEATHRQLIYESTMHVPLVFHCPGVVDAGAVMDRSVAATVDVMPTILDLLGMPSPRVLDGHSLVSVSSDSTRAVYMETLSTQLNDGWAPLFGVRDLRGKYIEAPTPEFYDLITDPNESTSLLASREDDVERLADALEALTATFPGDTGSATVTPTDEEIQRLAALGYVVGSGSAGDARSQLDPKIMIRSVEERLQGIHLMQRGRPHEAIAIFERLIEQSAGGASDTWSSLANCQMMIGKTDDAVRSGRRSVELAPRKPERWCALAKQYLELGNDPEAEVCLAEAERLDSGYGQVHMIRARHAFSRNRYGESERHCRKAIEQDPVRSAAEGNAFIGIIRRFEGDVDRAATSFELALTHDPRNGEALFGLAGILAERNEKTRAIELCQLLIEGQSEFLAGGRLMGRLYFEIGRTDIAVSILRTVIQKNPSDQLAHLHLARVFAALGQTEASAHHIERAAALGKIDFGVLWGDAIFAPVLDDPRVRSLDGSRQDD